FFIDAQAATFGLGIQAGHSPAQRQRLLLVIAQPLRHNRGPQRKNRRTVDLDLLSGHTALLSSRDKTQSPKEYASDRTARQWHRASRVARLSRRYACCQPHSKAQVSARMVLRLCRSLPEIPARR